MNSLKINRRQSTALINSLKAGVVPRTGLEHIAVGRKNEIMTLLCDLDNVKEGGASFRFIEGRYGSGKSFMLQIIRNYALERDYVVADVDLSPERRLVGANGQGLATYRELMQRLATKARPDGGALEAILQRWISNLQTEVMRETNLQPGDPAFNAKVQERIFVVINGMKELTHGFDFATTLSQYWAGFTSMNDDWKQSAMRWVRGEFSSKTEARKEIRVSEVVNDDNWYDFVKLWSAFIAKIGYSGLYIFIDEGVNLYKINNKVAREKNYEKLLTMFNDTMQGKAEHLGILFGTTPQCLEDTRRGLFSYEAIRTRLEGGRLVGNGLVDYSGPVLRLQTLTKEEIFVLLTRLQAVHAAHYKYEPRLGEKELSEFIQMTTGRLGTDDLLTPREVTRDFLTLLDLLYQNPDKTFDGIVAQGGFIVTPPTKDPGSENEEIFDEFDI